MNPDDLSITPMPASVTAAQKAGVLLSDLAPDGAEQGLLFSAQPADDARTDRLMDRLDVLNREPARRAVRSRRRQRHR